MTQGFPCFQLWSRPTLLPASSRGVSHGRETSSPGGKVGDGRGGRWGRGISGAMLREVAPREAAMVRCRCWGRWRCGVKGGGDGAAGVTEGGGDGAASTLREATMTPREAVGNRIANTKNEIIDIGWPKPTDTNHLLYQLAYTSAAINKEQSI
jgi:hypothetical protein